MMMIQVVVLVVLSLCQLGSAESATPDFNRYAELVEENISELSEKMEEVNNRLQTFERRIEILEAAAPVLPVAESCPTGSNRPVTFVNREDGSVDFNRNWADYKSGFGNIDGEFWLGLECLHQLTSAKDYSLQVDFGDFVGNVYQSRYSSFSVGPESDFYLLNVSGFDEKSTGGDSLTMHHNNMKFSTYDRDNDGWWGNYAETYTGGWWYNWIHDSHPTGTYFGAGDHGRGWNNKKGINWTSASRWLSFKFMKFTLIPKE